MFIDLSTAQRQVKKWMLDIWGDGILKEKRERTLRFLEEALELAQANGLTKEDALKQLEYTFSREPGSAYIELGQTQFVLFALAANLGIELADTYEDVYKEACTPARIAK